MDNLNEGRLFIVSAPAGTGKTTLVERLVKDFSNRIVRSVSYTSRLPRKGEINGKDYCFISSEEFEKKIKNHVFLEYAEVFGYYYGTSKKQVENILKAKKHAVLVIDTQGAEKLREAKTEAVFIFIMPPDMNILKNRLEGRNLDAKNDIDIRLSCAKEEMCMAEYYDYIVVNDDLEKAYEVFKAIFIAEEHRVKLKKD